MEYVVKVELDPLMLGLFCLRELERGSLAMGGWEVE